jgi:hypothetical protein
MQRIKASIKAAGNKSSLKKISNLLKFQFLYFADAKKVYLIVSEFFFGIFIVLSFSINK